MAAKKDGVTEIEIMKVNRGLLDLYILGTTPMICNRMSEKARHQILCPSGRKSGAEKASTLKHEPMQEFRASPYVNSSNDGLTYLQHLASAFKGAMASAALDLPGSSKAQIGRLAWVVGDRVDIYGVPKMFMSVVRSADMAKTPDIRTRVIIPRWACKVTISFTTPLLREQAVANLMSAAGLTQGVGDWRPEKGKGSYGSFEIVNHDDPRWLEVVKTGGRQAQLEAMMNPAFYDDDTEEMYTWFVGEAKRRGFDRSKLMTDLPDYPHVEDEDGNQVGANGANGHADVD